MSTKVPNFHHSATLRIVEFFSGIGGMHYALKDCGFDAEVVAAIEINTTANLVYHHNFPETPVLNRNIEGITIEDYNQLRPDVFLMSPPCQPFTRVGNKQASQDPRTKSFLYIISMLPRMNPGPEFLLMENVKGFDTSDTRDLFVKSLEDSGYSYQEYLLSPNQFGIPNSRLRYYLIARKKPFAFPHSGKILSHICSVSSTETMALGKNQETFSVASSTMNKTNTMPLNDCFIHCEAPENLTSDLTCHCGTENSQEKQNSGTASSSMSQMKIGQISAKYSNYKSHLQKRKCTKIGLADEDNISLVYDSKLCEICSRTGTTSDVPDCPREWCNYCSKAENECASSKVEANCGNISDFLESSGNDLSSYSLPEKVLQRLVLLLDIVSPLCNHSCCFTKAYGHYVEGTGSILQMSQVDDTSLIFKEYESMAINDVKRGQSLAPLHLRYFTPREVANLQCFPANFDFPENITRKQKYRLLGNSLNVYVVSRLLSYTFNA